MHQPVAVATTLSIVDIDDCAHAHLLAAERGMDGSRYLISGASITVPEAVDDAREDRSASDRAHHDSPRAGNWPTQLVAMAGLVRGDRPICVEMLRTLLHGHRFDVSRSINDLGMSYTPIAETFERTGAVGLHRKDSSSADLPMSDADCFVGADRYALSSWSLPSLPYSNASGVSWFLRSRDGMWCRLRLRAVVLAGIAARTGRSVLAVVPGETRSRGPRGGRCALLFDEPLPAGVGDAAVRARLTEHLNDGGPHRGSSRPLRAPEPTIIVSSVRAATQRLSPTPVEPIHVVQGEETPFDDLVAGLADLGYGRTDRVEGKGEFAGPRRHRRCVCDTGFETRSDRLLG